MISNIIYLIVVIAITEIGIDVKLTGSEKSGLFVSAVMLFMYSLIVYFSYFILKKKQKNIQYKVSFDLLFLRMSSLLIAGAVLFYANQALFYNLPLIIETFFGISMPKLLKQCLSIFIYFTYVSIYWFFFANFYNFVYQTQFTRLQYVISNLRIYLPMLIPWLMFSSFYDLLSKAGKRLGVEGDAFYISLFGLSVILFFGFYPPIIARLWGCKRLAGAKADELRSFLHRSGFAYREILSWPIFQGKMLTAGIVGPLPRFRYILITESLLQNLSIEELEAVLAHEMGHGRYYHMWLYFALMFGFFLTMWQTHGLFLYGGVLLFSPDIWVNGQWGARVLDLYIFICHIGSLFLFLRFLFGYFMRSFERQADLYAATLVRPEFVIAALEKIGILTGNTRDIPSWHHYSIRQRVEAIRSFAKDPLYFARHNKKVGRLFILVIFLFIITGVLVGRGNYEEMAKAAAYEKVVLNLLRTEANNPLLHLEMGNILYKKGHLGPARRHYEKAMELSPEDPTILNNLAWLLVTGGETGPEERKKALELAKRAVGLKREPAFLDTLAEAYFVNGMVEEAIVVAKEALLLADKDRDYFRSQVKRFESALKKNKTLGQGH